MHDLTQPFKDCSDDEDHDSNVKYVLALKKWSGKVNPATEFRCFIRNRRLIAIEQRDTTNYYSHMSEEKDDIVSDKPIGSERKKDSSKEII